MAIAQSTVTLKYQATIPKEIRRQLGIEPGEKVTWHTLRGMVILDVHKKIKNPVRFLTSQMRESISAVRLVKQVRDEIA